ncbi:MAG: EAL domain-containing protein [Alphaproteobacteria bacterium]|nr:EAL domain-containing protein [Alphaproteobacteria bacterium]
MSEQEDNVVDLGTRRPIPRPQGGFAALQPHLTFRNIVIALGLATFLIFIGSVVSARIAFLFAALLCLAAMMAVEMVSRRKWEKEMTAQLQRMNGDYDRLVRETARNRNDLVMLKKSLADAGAAARGLGRMQATEGLAVEQRMIKSLAEQLSRLGGDDGKEDSPLDIGALEKSLPQASPDAIVKNLTDEQVLTLVRAAVKQDRIDLFMQPIVNLPQRKMRFFEMFSRIRIKPQVYLAAERYIEVAIRQDLAPSIDNLLLLRSLQMIRDTGDDGHAYFCNITSLTLNDPKFMGDLVEFIAQNRDLAPRLVFELGQRDLASISADTLPVLGGLSRLGCRFSMDLVKSISFDYAQLEARRIRFIKVEAGLLLKELKDSGGLRRLKRMKAELDTNGIDMIVEKIESEKQLIELLDLDIDYGQGYLFGKPEPAQLRAGEDA